MAATLNGPTRWWANRDEEGHREYHIIHEVRSDKLDGPAIVMVTPGLPAIGSIWSFDNDLDSWAYCWPTRRVTPKVSKEPNTLWEVETLFSTKPLFRCQDETVEDPLLEPQKISGSFVKYTQEVAYDKDNNLIKNSAHELVRGPNVEFDFNRPTVRIEQNVSVLNLGTITSMVDTVNNAVLWGLAARTVKLSNVTWERKLYGTCNFYYTRIFDFDINFNTFDRTLLDEGTKVLQGHWSTTGSSPSWVVEDIDGAPADATNPAHFMRAKDRKGENIRIVLDGNGVPAETVASAGTIDVKYYTESNFLLLGIPTVIG